jgi:hypothetical protein
MTIQQRRIVATSLLAGLLVTSGADARTSVSDGNVQNQVAAAREKSRNTDYSFDRSLALRDFKIIGARIAQNGDLATVDPKGGKLIFELPESLKGKNLRVQVQYRLDTGGALSFVADASGLIARPLGNAEGPGSSIQGEATFIMETPLRVVVMLKPNTHLQWVAGAIYHRIQ